MPRKRKKKKKKDHKNPFVDKRGEKPIQKTYTRIHKDEKKEADKKICRKKVEEE